MVPLHPTVVPTIQLSVYRIVLALFMSEGGLDLAQFRVNLSN